MTLKVGDLAPDFTLDSHLDKKITLSQFRGKTTVLAFYPLAWTPVCSGQIPSYEQHHAKMAEWNVQFLGISVDHVPCLKAWSESINDIHYPLLSDFWPHGEIASRYGVMREDGRSERALFVIDAEGVIRYIDIHEIDDSPDNAVLFGEIAKLIPGLPVQDFLPQATGKPLPSEGVVMYCTRWCPDCNRARNWMSNNKVKYTEVDVTKNLEAAEQIKVWAGGDRVTPTITINGEVLVGWDEEKVRKLVFG